MKLTRRQKQIVRTIRIPFEWIGIGLGLALFPILPRRAFLALCDVVSAVMFACDPKGRHLALTNLRIVLGTTEQRGTAPASRAERLILRRSFRNMARSAGYAFWTCYGARRKVVKAGEMDERGRSFLAKNRQAITVSGHIGCWEILSQLAFLQGHKMMSVAKDIGTRGMTQILMRARRSIGQSIVRAEGAFRPLLKGIRSGCSLGLLVDQVVDVKDGGVWVRFFGHPMPVSAAPAFFSAKAKAPIVVAWSRPLKDGRWRCETVAEYSPDDARETWKLIQTYTHDLERVIRRHPSCWVLNYRYFKRVPTREEIEQLQERERTCNLGTKIV